jgi:hypothetical protein
VVNVQLQRRRLGQYPSQLISPWILIFRSAEKMCQVRKICSLAEIGGKRENINYFEKKTIERLLD